MFISLLLHLGSGMYESYTHTYQAVVHDWHIAVHLLSYVELFFFFWDDYIVV